MGVIRNDVGRPSNRTIMIRRVLKLVGVLIIVLLAVLAGYYLKGKENKKVDNKVNDSGKVTTNNKNKENQTSKNEFENYFNKSELKEVKGQNCIMNINDDGSLHLRTNFIIEEYNKDIKINGLEEKAKYLAVFNFSEDASSDFAVLTENNNLYIARFSDSDSEINFKKMDVGKNEIESLITSDKTNYYVDGYIKFKNSESLSRIIYDCSSNSGKCVHHYESEIGY